MFAHRGDNSEYAFLFSIVERSGLIEIYRNCINHLTPNFEMYGVSILFYYFFINCPATFHGVTWGGEEV
jgi:hypothetical protein